ncbi:regulatory protein YcgZ [Enterobacter sp. UNJFSC 003]|uniref:regulatory protein YcgZ n=1 Tax=Enterobacter sp. UNJFSC 003 TaxID=3122077 RepID=UPI002EC64E1C|nr:regulatory protein YcgZ [Serratia liquefaciens]
MRRNRAPSSAESAITLYFNKNNIPSQQETLGLIVSEIIKENVQLSRMTICTKLLRRIEESSCEAEKAHYNGLIALFFER